MLNYDLAQQRLEELRQEAAHDRLVEGLAPQPRRTLVTYVHRELMRVHDLVTELGRTKPVRRRVASWISQ